MAVLGVAALAGCDRLKSPAEVCADPETHQNVFGLLVDLGEDALPSMAGIMTPQESAGVRQELEKIRHERNLMTVSFATLEAYDKTTKKISCNGKIAFTLPPADRTGLAQQSMGLLIEATNGVGLPVPAGLAGGSATAMVDFTRQPAASGDSLIYGVEHANESVGALVMLASSRYLLRRAASEPAKPAEVMPSAAYDPGTSPEEIAAAAAAGDTKMPAIAEPTPPGQQEPESYPTSFNCESATRFDESAICSNPDFAKRDLQLAAWYQQAVAKDGSGQVRREARAALAARASCTTVECVRDWFNARERATSPY